MDGRNSSPSGKTLARGSNANSPSRDLPKLPSKNILSQLEMILRANRHPSEQLGSTQRKSTCVNDLGLLTQDGDFLFRINQLRRYWFLTDRPTQSHDAVYSYPDESEQILGYLHRAGLSRPPCAVEIGVGCGHTILRLNTERRFGIDVNPRAIRLLQFNSQLNGRGCEGILHDIRKGFPQDLKGRIPTGTLIFGNLPFAISPKGVSLPRAVDGGRDGLDLTVAALGAVRSLRSVRAVFLCNSLGDGRRWQIETTAQKAIPGAKISWHILPKARLWRVNGRLISSNPMKLDPGLEARAACVSLVSKDASARLKYVDLAGSFMADGWTVLGRGVLDIQV